MRKRITSLLLTLVMLLSLVPAMGVTASAATTGDGTKGNPFVVNTYEDWKEKMELTGDKYIKLGADIDTSTMNGGYGLGPNDFVSAIGRSYLDLNGKKLTLKKAQLESGVSGTYFIRLIAGELIIDDSKGGGEIVGVNNVTRRYMQLIDVTRDTKLTLNSGRLYLECNPDSDTPNATILFSGTVEINGGTVSVSKWGEWDEPAAYIIRQNFALQAAGKTSSCCALINGGTFDGRVLLGAIAKDSGVADNVITGGDFKKSIYIQKDEEKTGDVPLNVSIQGGTYHYTPGYMTVTSGENAGKRESNPLHLFQFATMGFRDDMVYCDDVVYDAFKGGSLFEPDKYDMNAFASMFPKNVIITAEGQEYDYYDARYDEPQHISVNDAAFTGSSTALDLARLVNSHYKTITVTTIPENSLKDMTLKVGSDGEALSAQGNSAVSGDVALGSDGNLTKTVYITARGNKQLKEMCYSNPSKIDFGYRLNIFKDGVRVTDYTGDSLTYAAVGDEISVSVQLQNFEFEEGVYTFRLALWPYLRGSEAQIGETLVGLWKLTAKEEPALVAHSITVDNGYALVSPSSTAKAGDIITVWADDRRAHNQMFTEWHAATPGVTFANMNQQRTTFVMPDRDVHICPSYMDVSFTRQPIDSWPQINHAGKAYASFSVPISKWELKEGNTTVVSSNNSSIIKAEETIAVDIPAQSSEVEKTYTVVVTAFGQEFSSNEFKVKWVKWPKAPAVEFTPADGTQFVGEIEVIASDALYAGEEIFEIAYTTDGTDPMTSTKTNYANTDTEHITLTETTTIKARTYNGDATADAEKWGPLATATFTKYSNTTLPKPTITPEGLTYTGSIKAYLTAPKLDGVEMEYCLMRTGDPNITGNWKTYDPETGITVNDFGTITLYARSFKNVDMGDHVEHLTSENVSATYTRTYSAAIDNVTVSGKVGDTLTQDVVIRMNGDRFENVTAGEGEDVSDWFNLPAGLTAKVKELSEADGYHENLTVTISGTPEAASVNAISVTIPKEKLYANNAADLTVLSNPKAVYNIVEDGTHMHNYSAWAKLDDNCHYQTCSVAGCDEPTKFGDHTFGNWTSDPTNADKHFKECSVCKGKVEASHVESSKITVTPAGIGTEGTWKTECVDCGKQMNTGTFPALTAISEVNVTVTAPVKGATPEDAMTVAGSPYSVAATDWEPIVSSTFAGGTKYTVKVSLEATGNNRFTDTTTFKINGKAATIVTKRGEEAVITLTFDATEGTPAATEYTVTVKDDGNGTASANHVKAVAGTEIKLTATPNSGYHFKEWKVVKGGVIIKDNKFTMPADNVEVKAIFEKNSSTGGGGGGGVTTYSITVKSSKNGDVTASHKSASKGTTVTLTVDPDKGYVLDTLTVLDGKDKEIKLTEKNGKYTFTMPASKVTVEAMFKATGNNPFIDVPAGSYYEDAVIWAVDKGITTGTSATTFNPNGICTRAQAVTFLWRAAGSPAAKSAVMPFTDVKAGSYYYDAVLWAVENGITKGTSDTTFSPDATCSRAQIVTFLWRANGSPAVSGNSAFTDVAADAYYAAAVTWAEKNDITGGIGGGLFGSNNNCTRAQIVTFIYRNYQSK